GLWTLDCCVGFHFSLPFRRCAYYDVILSAYYYKTQKEYIMNATALEQEYQRPALTHLSDEEELFRSSIREFAEGEVRPRVEKMEHEGKLDQDLIRQCF